MRITDRHIHEDLENEAWDDAHLDAEDEYALAEWVTLMAMYNGTDLSRILHAIGTHKPPVLSDGQVAELARTSAFSFNSLRAFFRRSDGEDGR